MKKMITAYAQLRGENEKDNSFLFFTFAAKKSTAKKEHEIWTTKDGSRWQKKITQQKKNDM